MWNAVELVSFASIERVFLEKMFFKNFNQRNIKIYKKKD